METSIKQSKAILLYCRRSGSPVIRVYDEAGNVIETHEHAGEFKKFLLIDYPAFSTIRAARKSDTFSLGKV